MTIHVALSIHDRDGTYARHAGVTLASLLRHTSGTVVAHILHDETLTDENRRYLCEIAEQAASRIVFYPLRLPDEWIGVSTGSFTSGMLFRLLAPTLLLSVDKLLYFDCDLVVGLDIAELWNEPLAGRPLAAVLDRGVAGLDVDHQVRLRKAGFDLQRYFNSGVLVLDLAWLRREVDLTAKFALFLQHFPDTMMLDQDYLNWLFQDHYCQLPEKYNTLVKCCRDIDPFDADGRFQPRIWHFSGMKPWERYESKLDQLYWLVLAQTPWKDQAVPGLLAAVDVKMNQLLNSRSWKLTAPYRAVGDWLRGRLGWFR